jgi:signal transduction histidine kinase
MVVAGLLALRSLDAYWRQALILTTLFDIVAYGTMMTLEHQRHVLPSDQSLAVYEMTTLYTPHLGILLVALIVGFKVSWLIAGATLAYVAWMGGLLDTVLANLGPPIFVALSLPFTAILVDRLLDEVENEARRARQAEISLDIMAHDLGNPLSVLSASLDMLEEQRDVPGQRDVLMRAIKRSARTLRHLLDEFREIPHLDRPAPMEAVDLAGIVQDVIEYYARPMCAEREQTLHVDIQPVEVIGASSRLERMARELLTNAMKYSPSGGRIEVTLRAREQAVLKVSDNGWGISEQDLPYVFEQHWRGSAVSPKAVSGRGLGLFICKKIVENHRGRIEVASKQGQGSTFTVHLPLPGAAAPPSSPGVESP